MSVILRCRCGRYVSRAASADSERKLHRLSELKSVGEIIEAANALDAEQRSSKKPHDLHWEVILRPTVGPDAIAFPVAECLGANCAVHSLYMGDSQGTELHRNDYAPAPVSAFQEYTFCGEGCD